MWFKKIMKTALIGYGAMGKLIETLLKNDNHEIVAIIDETDAKLSADELSEKLTVAEVAIDFSTADAVFRNVEACMIANVALVEGTTGWNKEIETVRKMVEKHEGSFVFGANFSVGVNLFYRIVSNAAELFSKFNEYETFIEERHHSRKLDAPSGTALKLQELVSQHITKDFSVAATRAGNIPGTHIVGFDGMADTIELTHTARSREGFASGSIVAAKWIVGKKGFWEFTEVMDEIVGTRSDSDLAGS
jgi:4-hydroxy-tetrahydrodipicolinate reductase